MVQQPEPAPSIAKEAAASVAAGDAVRSWRTSLIICCSIMVLVLIGTQLDLLAWVWQTGQSNPDYSHVFLVIPFSLALLWFRRQSLKLEDCRPSGWAITAGCGLVIVAGLMRALSVYLRANIGEGWALIPCLAGVALICGGWAALRWAGPAILFLVFLFPIPRDVAGLLSGNLQHVATVASTYVMQTLGIPAVSEGNVIWLTDESIGVAQACSG